MDKKNSAHNRYLSHPTRANKQYWTLLGAELQRKSRRLKIEWWISQDQEIQRCADEGRAQGFYDAMKKVNGSLISITCPLNSANGVLLKDKITILERWAEYFKDLLNTANPTDPSEVAQLPQYPTVLQSPNGLPIH